jgi:hypothetical protein
MRPVDAETSSPVLPRSGVRLGVETGGAVSPSLLLPPTPPLSSGPSISPSASQSKHSLGFSDFNALSQNNPIRDEGGGLRAIAHAGAVPRIRQPSKWESSLQTREKPKRVVYRNKTQPCCARVRPCHSGALHQDPVHDLAGTLGRSGILIQESNAGDSAPSSQNIHSITQCPLRGQRGHRARAAITSLFSS